MRRRMPADPETDADPNGSPLLPGRGAACGQGHYGEDEKDDWYASRYDRKSHHEPPKIFEDTPTIQALQDVRNN